MPTPRRPAPAKAKRPPLLLDSPLGKPKRWLSHVRGSGTLNDPDWPAGRERQNPFAARSAATHPWVAAACYACVSRGARRSSTRAARAGNHFRQGARARRERRARAQRNKRRPPRPRLPVSSRQVE